MSRLPLLPDRAAARINAERSAPFRRQKYLTVATRKCALATSLRDPLAGGPGADLCLRHRGRQRPRQQSSASRHENRASSTSLTSATAR
jgi:hypothetical protein